MLVIKLLLIRVSYGTPEIYFLETPYINQFYLKPLFALK
jgi:hypothetical protein